MGKLWKRKTNVNKYLDAGTWRKDKPRRFKCFYRVYKAGARIPPSSLIVQRFMKTSMCWAGASGRTATLEID